LTAPKFTEQTVDYRKIYEKAVELSPGKIGDAKAAISSFGTFLKKA
jgi:hypothetical protein